MLNGEADADEQASDWSADADNTSDWDNEILFCGYRLDGDTGLYHVRNRAYHPSLGKWLQRDPISRVSGSPEVLPEDSPYLQFLNAMLELTVWELGLSPDHEHHTGLLDYLDGMNLYEYLGGYPTMRIDPYGLAWLDWLLCPIQKTRTYKRYRNICENVKRKCQEYLADPCATTSQMEFCARELRSCGFKETAELAEAIIRTTPGTTAKPFFPRPTR